MAFESYIKSEIEKPVSYYSAWTIVVMVVKNNIRRKHNHDGE